MQPMVDFETSPLHGQLGSAVLDLEGKIIRTGGQMLAENTSILFRMLVEVGMLRENDFERLVVSLSSEQYLVSRDASHVYIVRTKAN